MYGKQNTLIEFSIIGFVMNYKSNNRLKKLTIYMVEQMMHVLHKLLRFHSSLNLVTLLWMHQNIKQ
jgi:hypothetical protein